MVAFFRNTREIWILALILAAIVLVFFLFYQPTSEWQANNAHVSNHIKYYRAYYNDCLQIVNDAEMCGNLAGAFAIR